MESEKRWAPIPGWPGYRVSDDGILETNKRPGGRTGFWRPKAHSTVEGYVMVQLVHKRVHKTYHMNTLVLLCHGPPRPTGKSMALHNNGDPSDNRLENLRWGYAKDNSDDRRRHGRTARGDRNGSAKLRSSDLKLIRELRSSGIALSALGVAFNVSESAIRRFVNGKTWKDVTHD